MLWNNYLDIEIIIGIIILITLHITLNLQDKTNFLNILQILTLYVLINFYHKIA